MILKYYQQNCQNSNFTHEGDVLAYVERRFLVAWREALVALVKEQLSAFILPTEVFGIKLKWIHTAIVI